MALVIALIESTDQALRIGHCLEDGGHRMIIIDNFRKAKALLLETPCDLIISDVHLENGGSVFDFLKWVKSKPQLLSIPFVLISLEPTKTAKNQADGVRLAARVFGAARYISIDVFDPVFLLKELAEYLPKIDSSDVLPNKQEKGE